LLRTLSIKSIITEQVKRVSFDPGGATQGYSKALRRCRDLRRCVVLRLDPSASLESALDVLVRLMVALAIPTAASGNVTDSFQRCGCETSEKLSEESGHFSMKQLLSCASGRGIEHTS
jgi:hypothetical protein